MDPYGNPIPSHSWDHPDWGFLGVEETLQAMGSPNEHSNLRVNSPQYSITDSELFGILSENVIDEIESDFDYQSDPEIVQDNENIQEIWATQDVWVSGNPANSVDLPFLMTPGLKETIADGPLQYFEALCSSELLELVKDYTNEYGEREKTASVSSQSRKKAWVPVTCEDIKLFFGLLLHMGFIKLNRICDYWKKDSYFNQPIFGRAMSRNRFLLIMRMLCVSVGQVPSSYCKVKNIIDYFNSKMLNIYYPSCEIVIDESMMLWRGRLWFRQYMKGKRNKYGLKFYALADQLGVVMKLHLYGGASDVLVGGRNHVKKVVNHMIQEYLNVGHHLFVDNFYTSIDLIEELFEKKTYCTGTLRSKRKNNPKEIERAKLKKGELCIVHKNNTCVLKWMDQREVWAASSKYNGNLEISRNRRGHTKLKPQMVIQYNKYMKSVDRHDQMLSYYSCQHKTLRWYKKVIIHIIQVILVNSFLLYNKYTSKNVTFYDFRLSVIKSIIEPRIPATLQQSLTNRTHCIMKLEKDSRGNTKRRRCNHCWRTLKKRVATLFACENCIGQPGLCIECFRPYHNY